MPAIGPARQRGDDADLEALFAADDTGLIDYVLALEAGSGRCFFFTRRGDQYLMVKMS